ncbi:MAG: RNA polymerase sigma factor [Acidimicrobiia bacterium]
MSETASISGPDWGSDSWGDHDFATVLDAAKDGQEWAWQLLFRRFAGPVTGYVTGRGSPDPEDTAGETLLQVARNIHGFEGDEDSFRSWVFVIAHRRMIDARRASSRRPVLRPLESAPDRSSASETEDEVIGSLLSPDMVEALAAITDTQREVLLLRTVADLSLEDVAKILGKRVGAIKGLQRRGLTALRDHLERRGVSP